MYRLPKQTVDEALADLRQTMISAFHIFLGINSPIETEHRFIVNRLITGGWGVVGHSAGGLGALLR